MKISIPKLPKMGLGSKSEITGLVVVGAIALGIWYFTINPSTRKFDLLGTLGVDKILPQLRGSEPTLTAPELPMDAIPVTSSKPQEVTSEPNLVNTVPIFPNPSGAYATSAFTDTISVA